MERFSAAWTSGFPADSFSDGNAELTAELTTAPAGKTKPSSTAFMYLWSTWWSVALPTPIATYAIIAARIAQGKSWAMNNEIPLTNTAMKIIAVQKQNPMRAPIIL